MSDNIGPSSGLDLEEQFFRKQNEELLKQMRERVAKETQQQSLQEALGISDKAVLDHLISLGVTAETASAMSLVPLIHVAWSDGSLDAKERDAVLRAARGAGLESGTAGYQLLEGWLTQRPEPQLLQSWQAYMASITPNLSAEEKGKLREQIVGRARQVAEATGGFLGLNKVSPAEQKALTELDRAFA